MKSSVTKVFRKKLDGLPASVQEQAALPMLFGVQILATIVFSSNELASANQSIRLVLV